MGGFAVLREDARGYIQLVAGQTRWVDSHPALDKHGVQGTAAAKAGIFATAAIDVQWFSNGKHHDDVTTQRTEDLRSDPDPESRTRIGWDGPCPGAP